MIRVHPWFTFMYTAWKSVHIRNFSGPYSVCMQKNADKKTPNMDTFHAVVYSTEAYSEPKCLISDVWPGSWTRLCSKNMEQNLYIFRFLRLVRKMKWEKSFRKCKSMFKNNNKNTELLCSIYSKLIMKTPLVSLLSALIDFMPLVFFYISWKVFFSGYRKRTVAWNQ